MGRLGRVVDVGSVALARAGWDLVGGRKCAMGSTGGGGWLALIPKGL